MKSFLAQRWFLILLVLGVASALAFPRFFLSATARLEPHLVIALALFLMAWTMPSRSLADEMKKPWAALWAVVISYAFLPGCGWLLGGLVPWPDVRVGLLLSASVPCTLASAVLWTRLAGGNEATALFAVVVSTLSSWAVTTTWLTLLTGRELDLPARKLMEDLVLTLVVPVALGQLLRTVPSLAHLASRRKSVLGILAQMLVLSIVVKAAGKVGQEMDDNHRFTLWTVVTSAALAVSLHVGGLAGGFWSSRWLGFDRPRQIAVAISCSQKTLPVSLLLFERYFKESFPLALIPMLFYHVGQLILDTFIADRWLREKHKT